MMKRWVFVLAPCLLIACVSRSSTQNTRPDPVPPPSSTQQPVLAVVSADKVMNTVGGDGVGVFVEYKRGGTWHIWWTCDTKRSAQTCGFNVQIASAAPIQNLQTEGLLASDQASITGDGWIRATTNTGSNLAGVTFQTAPGARIELEAIVAGIQKTGDYIFFVSKNSKGEDAVNGDYMGYLTNPLWLEPDSP